MALLLLGPSPACFRATAWAAIGPAANPNALSGIGAVLVSNGTYPLVSEIVPGGPAGKDGRLKVNDHITGVAQGDAAFVDCAGMSLDKVVDMVRGKPGTTVRLQVIPAGGDATKPEVIPLVRAQLKLNLPAGVTGTDQAPAIPTETEAKLDKAVKIITEATRKLLVANMEKEVGTVTQATGLDAAGKSALEAAAANAVDQCVQKSAATIGDNLRSEFKSIPAAQMGLFLSQVGANADTYAKYMQTQSGNWPADQPAWQDALKQTLNPKQAAAWNAAEAAHRQAVEQQLGDFSTKVANFAAQQVKQTMDEKVERIEAVLVLPKDRRDKLNAAAQSMLDQFGKETAARAEKALLGMDDDARKEALNQRQGLYNWLQPAPQTKWDDGLAKLLTPEETHRLQTAGDDRKTRRAAAMGKILAALLDEKIAFTAAQRQKLEPILQRAVRGVPDLVDDQDMDNYFYYSPATFYGAIANAPAGEVQAILDPIQWRHWQEVSKLKSMPDPNMYVSNAIQLPDADDAAKPARPVEPEDVERAVSDFLAQKSGEERERILAENILRAEDIARVAHLSDDAASQLQTAARGAADAAMAGWNTSAESMVRSAIAGVLPGSVKERLASIQGYQFQQLEMNAQQFNRPGGRPSSVWDNTVKAVLTPDEANAWKQETDVRSAYRQQAIAALVVAAFDQRNNLTPDQWVKLEPLVTKTMADSGEEFGLFFASSQPWFLQSFSIFLPIAGIPEEEMKSILTTDQWERWTGSNEYSNANQYWTMIDQNRPRQKAPKLAAKVR